MYDTRQMSELHAETERVYFDFLLTDLALCFTFVDRSKLELEMGNRNAVQRLLVEAEKGHAAITRFVAHLADFQHRNEIEGKLNALCAALESARHQLFPWLHREP
jgi:hypothetical protein